MLSEMRNLIVSYLKGSQHITALSATVATLFFFWLSVSFGINKYFALGYTVYFVSKFCWKRGYEESIRYIDNEERR